MRNANIRCAPTTSATYPWNVGLYDQTAEPDGGYVESVGAVSHAEALRIADAWINHRHHPTDPNGFAASQCSGAPLPTADGCQACGRPSLDCSQQPCLAVTIDRGHDPIDCADMPLMSAEQRDVLNAVLHQLDTTAHQFAADGQIPTDDDYAADIARALERDYLRARATNTDRRRP